MLSGLRALNPTLTPDLPPKKPPTDVDPFAQQGKGMELARCWGMAENGESVKVAVAPNLVEFDAEGPSWDEIYPSEAAVEVLSHAISMRSRPDDRFDAIVKIARSARAVRGTRGEATDAITELLPLMDTKRP